MRTRLVCLTGLAAAVASPSAEASEGAASYYFRRRLRLIPGRGSARTGFQRREPDIDVRRQGLASGVNGRQTFGLNAFAVYEFLAGLYTFEQPMLGGRLQIGVARARDRLREHDRLAADQPVGTFSGSASDINIGDTLINPFSLTGTSASSTSKFTETSSRRPATTTRSRDQCRPQLLGVRHPGRLHLVPQGDGHGDLRVPGLMFNTMNPATDYHSGTEFHLDFMANQFVSRRYRGRRPGLLVQADRWRQRLRATLGPFMGELSASAPPCCGPPSSSRAAMSSSRSGCTTSPTPIA